MRAASLTAQWAAFHPPGKSLGTVLQQQDGILLSSSNHGTKLDWSISQGTKYRHVESELNRIEIDIDPLSFDRFVECKVQTKKKYFWWTDLE
jgi:hypothetical protein